MSQLREQPPETPKPDTKPETKEGSGDDKSKELRDAMRARLKDRLSGKPPEKAAPKEDAPKAKVEAKEEPEVKETGETKPEKKSTKVTQSRPQRSADEELIKAAADATAATKAAMDMVREAKAPKATKTEKPEASDFDNLVSALPAKHKSKIPILQAMEKRNPEKYKGIAERYAKNSQAVDKYSKRWEKDNPGQNFDPRSDEHNDFFAEHDVDWEQEDYHRAVASVETESILAEERKAQAGEIRKLKAENAARAIEPVVRAKQGRAFNDILKEAAPELTGIVGGDGQLNQEVFKTKLEEAPFLVEAALQELVGLAPFIYETERLFHPSGLFIDEGNQVQHQVADFCYEQEREIKSWPADKQRNEQGQMFATKDEWLKMDSADQASHWVLDQDSVVQRKREIISEKLKKRATEIDNRLKKLVEQKTAVPKPADGDDTKTAKKKEPVVDKPTSPTTSGDTKVDTLAKGVNNTADSFRSKLKARFAGLASS